MTMTTLTASPQRVRASLRANSYRVKTCCVCFKESERPFCRHVNDGDDQRISRRYKFRCHENPSPMTGRNS